MAKAAIAKAYVQVVPSMEGFFKKISDETSNTGRSIGAPLSRSVSSSLSTGLKRAGIAAIIGAGVVAGIGAGLAKAVVKKGLSRALDIEDAQASMRGLGYSAQQIEGVTESVKNAVTGTSFALNDAMKLASSALASGIPEGKGLENYIKLIGDTATITGSSLDEIGSIFSKIQGSGIVYTDELQQIADRGLPIFTWLSEAYGVSQKELRKMVSEGKVDAETFKKVLEENIGGAALASADTTRGALANVNAALGRLGAVAIEGGLPYFQEALVKLIPFIDELAKRLQPLASTFWATFGPLIVENIERIMTNLIGFLSGDIELPSWMIAVQNFFKSFADFLSGEYEMPAIFSELGEVFGELKTFFVENKDLILDFLHEMINLLPQLLQLLVLILPKVTEGLKEAPNILTSIGAAIVTVFNVVKEIVAGLVNTIANYLSGMLEIILLFKAKWDEIWGGTGNVLQKIGASIKLIFLGIISVIVNVINAVIGVINTAINAINALIRGIVKTGQTMGGFPGVDSESLSFIPNIPSIPLPKLAVGGDIHGPTIAMLGEGGRSETVTDLGRTNDLINSANAMASRALSNGGNANNINITIVKDDSRDYDEFYEYMIKRIEWENNPDGGEYNYGIL